MKFHNFTDKQRVMNAACHLSAESDHSAHTGPRISVFDDYSAAVVKTCKAFDDMKDQLKRMNIDYALMYPATIRMSVNYTDRGLVDSLG